MTEQTSPLEIHPHELHALQDAGKDIQLLDIREDWERSICALPDSIGIPMMSLPDNLSALSPDRPLIVFCHHGQRSLQVVDWLRGQGYAEATSLHGGIEAWALEIDGTVERY